MTLQQMTGRATREAIRQVSTREPWSPFIADEFARQGPKQATIPEPGTGSILPSQKTL